MAPNPEGPSSEGNPVVERTARVVEEISLRHPGTEYPTTAADTDLEADIDATLARIDVLAARERQGMDELLSRLRTTVIPA